MKKEVNKIFVTVLVISIITILSFSFALAAKPLGGAGGKADIRNFVDTGSLHFHLRSLDLNNTGAGSYKLEYFDVLYQGSIEKARISGNDAYFAGPDKNSDSWVYIAVRDHAGGNDIVWIKITDRVNATNYVGLGKFPGDGWFLDKGNIRVR